MCELDVAAGCGRKGPQMQALLGILTWATWLRCKFIPVGFRVGANFWAFRPKNARNSPLLGFLGQKLSFAYLIYYVGGPGNSLDTKSLFKVIPPGGIFRKIAVFGVFVEFPGYPAIIINLMKN